MKHGSDTTLPYLHRYGVVPNYCGYCTVEIRALNGPKALFEVSDGKTGYEKSRILEQANVKTRDPDWVKSDLDTPVPRLNVVLLAGSGDNIVIEEELNKILERRSTNVVVFVSVHQA
jgi:hypothetical protein